MIINIADRPNPESIAAKLMLYTERDPTGCLLFKGWPVFLRLGKRIRPCPVKEMLYMAFHGPDSLHGASGLTMRCGNPSCCEPTHARPHISAKNVPHRRRAG